MTYVSIVKTENLLCSRHYAKQLIISHHLTLNELDSFYIGNLT